MGPCVRRDDSGVCCYIDIRITPTRSRDALRPSFAKKTSRPQFRGRRECRMRAAPAVSCAVCTRSARMSIQGSGEHPTFPAQWLYGLWRDLPGERLFCLRSALGSRTPPGALTPASRRRDHTLLPYAKAALVSRNLGVHRNPSNVRDDGRRPLSGTGWRSYTTDLHFRKSEIFFISGLDMTSANRNS